METKILGHDNDAIGVEVYDVRSIRHIVNVEWDGNIEKHTRDEGTYPKKRANRTLEEQKIMTQVESRARFAAQMEFPEEDILDPEWDPRELDRALQALETMHVEAFAEQFRTCYEMITSPESFGEVTAQTAQIIFQPFYVDANNDVTAVPRPVLQYKQRGEVLMTEEEPGTFDQPGTKFTVTLPPMTFAEDEYEFPDGFQVFLIKHMGAKVRDVYIDMGEDPPENVAFDRELPGKLLTAADDEFYEDW